MVPPLRKANDDARHQPLPQKLIYEIAGVYSEHLFVIMDKIYLVQKCLIA